jgi:hypothetical protein
MHLKNRAIVKHGCFLQLYYAFDKNLPRICGKRIDFEAKTIRLCINIGFDVEMSEGVL